MPFGYVILVVGFNLPNFNSVSLFRIPFNLNTLEKKKKINKILIIS